MDTVYILQGGYQYQSSMVYVNVQAFTNQEAAVAAMLKEMEREDKPFQVYKIEQMELN